jgi:hypothetical protein
MRPLRRGTGGWPLPCIPRRLVQPLPHAVCQPECRHADQDQAGRHRPSYGRSLPLARSTTPCRNHANVPHRNSSHCCSTSGVTSPRPRMPSLSPHVSSDQRIDLATACQYLTQFGECQHLGGDVSDEALTSSALASHRRSWLPPAGAPDRERSAGTSSRRCRRRRQRCRPAPCRDESIGVTDECARSHSETSLSTATGRRRAVCFCAWS